MGKSDNMMMLEHVKDIVSALQVEKTDGLWFVALDKNGQIEVFDNIEDCFWSAAKEAFIFHFSPSKNTTRHIDENYIIHKQIILNDGYKICIEDDIPPQICLYHNEKQVSSTLLNKLSKEDFGSTFNSVWNEYIFEVSWGRDHRRLEPSD